jgi:DNA-binding CsgD family transcriptional regulator
MADCLFLSEHTVRTHVQNLRNKLKVRSKFEAAVLALQASGQATPARAGVNF